MARALVTAYTMERPELLFKPLQMRKAVEHDLGLGKLRYNVWLDIYKSVFRFMDSQRVSVTAKKSGFFEMWTSFFLEPDRGWLELASIRVLSFLNWPSRLTLVIVGLFMLLLSRVFPLPLGPFLRMIVYADTAQYTCPPSDSFSFTSRSMDYHNVREPPDFTKGKEFKSMGVS